MLYLGNEESIVNEETHRKVEQYKCTALVSIALHALIEAGVVEKFECSVDDCNYTTREFDSADWRLKLSFDHIVEQSFGGSHRPENIRLLHHGCNSTHGCRTQQKKRGLVAEKD